MPGDEIEDDFIPDDLVLLSDGEDDVQLHAKVGLESTSLRPGGSVKEIDAEARITKKRKRKEKEKERATKKRKHAAIEEVADNESFLKSRMSLALSELTPIELDEHHIPAHSIADTANWVGVRTLDNLSYFISEALPSLKTRLGQRPKKFGAPTMIFVAAAALRVADAARVLKKMKTDIGSEKAGEVAKLFGKHIKVKEHADYLKRTRIGCAVGTPGRLGKLLNETGSLLTSALTHIIIDATFQDAKKRTIFDIPETRNDLFRTVLGANSIQKSIKDKAVQIILF